jgi:hypothetical protein
MSDPSTYPCGCRQKSYAECLELCVIAPNECILVPFDLEPLELVRDDYCPCGEMKFVDCNCNEDDWNVNH